MDHFFETIPGWFDFEDVYTAFVATAPAGAKFVEVGAWYGKSTAFLAVEIINSQKDITLFVVDHWRGSLEHQQGEFAEDAGIVVQGSIFPLFKSYLARVLPRINPIEMDSIEASKRFADGSLDLVFLDAGHEYASIRADIEAWFPKVRSGGIIAGHDFSPSWPGVLRAVTTFEPFTKKEILQVKNCWIHHKD